MSTEPNRKWSRVDRRLKLARMLLNDARTQNHESIARELMEKQDYRFLAAIVFAAHLTGALTTSPDAKALASICELIAMERAS